MADRATPPSATSSDFAAIEDAIAAFARGEFLVVVDDETRENEGDLIIAAEMVTAEKIAFMVRHTAGVICSPLPGERIDQLSLPQMVADNTEHLRTAFTVSVDYRHGTTTGISAADRALTIQALADAVGNRPPEAGDFARPGHIFPLRARDGGVLVRAGHTEATVDLARLAGLKPAGAICEIINDDGSMMRLPELKVFARAHGLHLISIADLVAYRRRTERLVTLVREDTLDTRHGAFRASVYRSLVDDTEHLALVMGDVTARGAGDAPDVLVRVHSASVMDDVFGSLRPGGANLVDLALERIGREGRGVFLYLRGAEGWGLGLDRRRLYDQSGEAETRQAADSRRFGTGAQILGDIGLKTIRILTNSPARYRGIEGYGLTITGREPFAGEPPAAAGAGRRAAGPRPA
ncbi:MAG: 3,4-dihydroxy-2-butanone-4-phosphate synthase [Alphaproteobacteria bacterium]